MKDKRIKSIERVLKNRELKFEIILNPNYSFESSGGQIMYCSTKKELNELKKEIIFCDGETMYRTR